MDKETAYSLMMAVLDDESNPADQNQLNQYLKQHPDLAEEWDALQWVDDLFTYAPMVEPPPLLIEQTLARLPDSRYRRPFVITIFTAALLAGVALIAGITSLTTPALGEAITIVRVLGTAVTATFRTALANNPLWWGYIFIMLSIVALWRYVYVQMVYRPLNAFNEGRSA